MGSIRFSLGGIGAISLAFKDRVNTCGPLGPPFPGGLGLGGNIGLGLFAPWPEIRGWRTGAVSLWAFAGAVRSMRRRGLNFPSPGQPPLPHPCWLLFLESSRGPGRASLEQKCLPRVIPSSQTQAHYKPWHAVTSPPKTLGGQKQSAHLLQATRSHPPIKPVSPSGLHARCFQSLSSSFLSSRWPS